MRILFIGDVFARWGRKILKERLNSVKEEYLVDFCIANGENAAGGKGISKAVANELYNAGVDAITLGNHTWDNNDVLSFIDDDYRIVRAYNFPPDVPGNGWISVQADNGQNIIISQLCCRLYMTPFDCPFRAADRLIEEIGNEKIIIIDVHGEATSEKCALGWYLNGRATAVIGTHTHIPTADERILPGGTAYITDAGMTGAYDSIIGMDIDSALKRFLTGMKIPFQVSKRNLKISAVLITVNDETGEAESIERLMIPSLLSGDNQS